MGLYIFGDLVTMVNTLLKARASSSPESPDSSRDQIRVNHLLPLREGGGLGEYIGDVGGEVGGENGGEVGP